MNGVNIEHFLFLSVSQNNSIARAFLTLNLAAETMKTWEKPTKLHIGLNFEVNVVAIDKLLKIFTQRNFTLATIMLLEFVSSFTLLSANSGNHRAVVLQVIYKDFGEKATKYIETTLEGQKGGGFINVQRF
jgi:hypothetical protein